MSEIDHHLFSQDKKIKWLILNELFSSASNDIHTLHKKMTLQMTHEFINSFQVFVIFGARVLCFNQPTEPILNCKRSRGQSL